MFNRFQRPQIPTITVQEAAERIKDATPLVLDVRETYEYTDGHIAGSRHVPLAQLPQVVKELASTDQEIITVCAAGGRSANATMFLLQNGYSKVFNMAGGMMAWSGARLPVERGSGK